MKLFFRLLMLAAALGIMWSTAYAADSKAYKGAMQKIPGTIAAGLYDEGGNGVAYQASRTYPNDVPQLQTSAPTARDGVAKGNSGVTLCPSRQR